MISCRSCGGKIGGRDIWRWLSSGIGELSCSACRRGIAGSVALLGVYVASGVLLVGLLELEQCAFAQVGGQLPFLVFPAAAWLLAVAVMFALGYIIARSRA